MTPETLGMPYKHVSFTTKDNIELNGWLVEQTVSFLNAHGIFFLTNVSKVIKLCYIN